MKYLVWIITLVLIGLALTTARWVPNPSMSGVIQDVKEETVTVKLAQETIEVTKYQTLVNYKSGERVIVTEENGVYGIGERVRTPSLMALFLIFVGVVVLVAGWNGVRSLLGLSFSFLVIFKFVLPQILIGSNPLVVALLASILILGVSYVLTHGVNAKVLIAILGTLGALVVTGILASIFGSMSNLTGFGSEEAGFLLGTLPQESFYNLLLAGIIVGSLGVLDDITISQAAIVEELKRANHRLGFKELFMRAMRVGHDHIASVVNTLVLVYAGSALPLLLLFITTEMGVVELLNYEMIAEEIVRTLVASTGLVMAVPLTTLIAAMWFAQKER